MNETMFPDDAALERLTAYIEERYFVFLEKETNPNLWPWSRDPILREFRFGNVFRGLDRGTIWLKNNIIDLHRDDGVVLLFNVLAYRIFNSIPTSENLGYFREWDEQVVIEKLKSKRDAGEPVFGRMSMVGARKDRIERACSVLDNFWKDLDSIYEGLPNTLEGANKHLMKFDGMRGAAGFNALAYEVSCDLTYTGVLEFAPDRMSWPGRSFQIDRGFKTVFKQKYKRESEYVDMMGWLLRYVNNEFKALGYIPILEMCDLCASLRGFYVYEQVRFGQGRARSRYRRTDDS